MAKEQLRKRPFQVTKKEDIAPEQLERINTHFDERIRDLDLRTGEESTPQFEGVQITADWRMRISDSGDFVVEKLENNVWVEKLGVVP